MKNPESLRAAALGLLDMANRTISFQRQEELIARAERLERKAQEMEMAETNQEARARIANQLLTTTDPEMLLRLRSTLDNLED